MTTLVVVLATCLFAWCAVLMLVRRAARAARRVGVRLSDRARSTVLAHGTRPAAEAARLRRDMDRAVAGARRAFTAAASVGAPTGDARSLLARLEFAARSVDGELRVIEAHPDSARLRLAVAGLASGRRSFGPRRRSWSTGCWPPPGTTPTTWRCCTRPA
jgi:hypothetical protein